MLWLGLGACPQEIIKLRVTRLNLGVILVYYYGNCKEYTLWYLMHVAQTLTLVVYEYLSSSTGNMSIRGSGLCSPGKVRPSEIDCENNLSSFSKVLY